MKELLVPTSRDLFSQQLEHRHWDLYKKLAVEQFVQPLLTSGANLEDITALIHAVFEHKPSQASDVLYGAIAALHREIENLPNMVVDAMSTSPYVVYISGHAGRLKVLDWTGLARGYHGAGTQSEIPEREALEIQSELRQMATELAEINSRIISKLEGAEETARQNRASIDEARNRLGQLDSR